MPKKTATPNLDGRTIVASVAAIVGATVIAGSVAWTATYGLGSYGWTLFLGVPLLLGYVAVSLYRIGGPKRLLRCVGVACLAAVTCSFGFLLLGWEGIICIVVTIPLGLPLVILGACLAYWSVHKRRSHPATTSLTLTVFVVVLAVLESQQKPLVPVFTKSTSLQVEASPAEVWQAIIRLERMPPPDDWLLRTGVACPQTVRIESAEAGGLRFCRLSTGELVERIEVWRPESQLRWRALSTPPPMQELNPFRKADPPHLHGFYRNLQGEFTLEPLSSRSTLVIRRTSYQHNLYPAQYWRFWCDLAAERIHLFVLRHVKRIAEAGRGA
jgi:hypothetical protein